MPSSEDEERKCKKILTQWSRKPENRVCADCPLKQPSWASVNTGALLCIRCSGAHRNMGVHISFVKSINLDRWTVPLMKKYIDLGGNKAVNYVYEAKMPKGAKPKSGCGDNVLKNFIRNKYEHKKYYSSSRAKKAAKKKERAALKNNQKEESDSSSGETDTEEECVEIKKPTPKPKRRKRPRKLKPKPKEKTKKVVVKEAPVLLEKKPKATAKVVESAPDLLDISAINLNKPAQEEGSSLFPGFLNNLPPSNNESLGDLLGFGNLNQQPQQQQQQQQQQSFQPNFSGFNQQSPAQNPMQAQQQRQDPIMSMFNQQSHNQPQTNPNVFSSFTQPQQRQPQQQPGFGFQQPQQRPQQQPMFSSGQQNVMSSFGPPQPQRPNQFQGFGQSNNIMTSFGQPTQPGGGMQFGQSSNIMSSFGQRPQPTSFGQPQRPQQMNSFSQQDMFGQQKQNMMSSFGQPNAFQQPMGQNQNRGGFQQQPNTFGDSNNFNFI